MLYLTSRFSLSDKHPGLFRPETMIVEAEKVSLLVVEERQSSPSLPGHKDVDVDFMRFMRLRIATYTIRLDNHLNGFRYPLQSCSLNLCCCTTCYVTCHQLHSCSLFHSTAQASRTATATDLQHLQPPTLDLLPQKNHSQKSIYGLVSGLSSAISKIHPLTFTTLSTSYTFSTITTQ